MKLLDSGHWIFKCDHVYFEDIHLGFVYLVCFDDGTFYIGRKKFRIKNLQGKESNWRQYKTSSKVVKNKIVEGYKADFFIIGLCQTYEQLVEYEGLIIERYIDNVKCLNQFTPSGRFLRLRESYEDADNKKAHKEGLLRFINSDEYIHPMQGKTHPNKGKSLPQTAPKKHVSIDNIQITDGDTNRWWPKNSPLPEGFKRGWKSRRACERTEKQHTASEFVGHLNHERAKKRYLQNPKFCVVCGSIIPYKKRLESKTCSVECQSKNRSRISKNTFSEEGNKKSIQTRLLNIAKSKGFDSYLQYSNAVVNTLQSKTYEETAEIFNISKSGVAGCVRFLKNTPE